MDFLILAYWKGEQEANHAMSIEMIGHCENNEEKFMDEDSNIIIHI